MVSLAYIPGQRCCSWVNAILPENAGSFLFHALLLSWRQTPRSSAGPRSPMCCLPQISNEKLIQRHFSHFFSHSNRFLTLRDLVMCPKMGDPISFTLVYCSVIWPLFQHAAVGHFASDNATVKWLLQNFDQVIAIDMNFHARGSHVCQTGLPCWPGLSPHWIHKATAAILNERVQRKKGVYRGTSSPSHHRMRMSSIFMDPRTFFELLEPK